MYYQEMSGQDRRAIFEPDENYPLLITHAGHTRPMARGEIEALRRDARDFEVDEAQASRILTERGSC